MGIEREVIEQYRGYDIIKFTSPAKDIIYNGNYYKLGFPQFITCVGYSVKEVKSQIDLVYERIKIIKEFESKRKR